MRLIAQGWRVSHGLVNFVYTLVLAQIFIDLDKAWLCLKLYLFEISCFNSRQRKIPLPQFAPNWTSVFLHLDFIWYYEPLIKHFMDKIVPYVLDVT